MFGPLIRLIIHYIHLQKEDVGLCEIYTNVEFYIEYANMCFISGPEKRNRYFNRLTPQEESMSFTNSPNNFNTIFTNYICVQSL